MNMLYAGLEEHATIVLVPSTALESVQLGGVNSLAALTMALTGGRAKCLSSSDVPRVITRAEQEAELSPRARL